MISKLEKTMFEAEKRDAMIFLNGIENGGKTPADLYNLISEFDPLLSFFLLKYLREKHPVTDRNSGPGERLLELLKVYPEISNMFKSGKNDPLAQWFEESYGVRSFINDPENFVDLIVEKLEG